MTGRQCKGTCAPPVKIGVIPENEKPLARGVDIYYGMNSVVALRWSAFKFLKAFSNIIFINANKVLK